MYEAQTFNAIMTRMLATISDDIDKREGSIIWDALAPAAIEMAQAYVELDNVLTLVFADTSNGEWLNKRTSELGVEINEAIPTTRYATFDVPVTIGARFSYDNVYYKVIQITPSTVVECETPGVIGNLPLAGTKLIPVTTISGLTSAVLGVIITQGAEKESDDALYDRYIERIKKPATSGNVYHYDKWAKEVVGVGKVKVFPLWNGAGTVKIVIVNSSYDPASAQLVSDVKTYIDPSDGTGEGAAPVGAKVTVVSATAKVVTISATLTLSGDWTLAQVKPKFEEAIVAYFRSVSFTDTVVRYNKISNLLLDTDGVVDFTNLTINGGVANVLLGDEEVPTLGTVTLT